MSKSYLVSQIQAMTKVLIGSVSDSNSINKHNNGISHPITNHNKAGSHDLQRLYRMSHYDHLRPVSSPPALAKRDHARTSSIPLEY